jgi:hypothetical protein
VATLNVKHLRNSTAGGADPDGELSAHCYLDLKAFTIVDLPVVLRAKDDLSSPHRQLATSWWQGSGAVRTALWTSRGIRLVSWKRRLKRQAKLAR